MSMFLVGSVLLLIATVWSLLIQNTMTSIIWAIWGASLILYDAISNIKNNS